MRRWIDTLTTLFLIFTYAPEGFALIGEATSASVILDSRPPIVSIDYPMGDEAFQPAAVETLRWSIQEDSYGVNPHPVVLFVVEGDSLIWTASFNPHENTSYTYPWQVVDRAVANAIFVVQTTDDFGWSAAESSATFSIFGSPTAIPTGDHDRADSGEPSRLGPIYPNPFNPATELQFALQQDTTVELALFDLTGRKIVVLARGNWPAGRHSVRWDGRDTSGRRAASGTYLARLQVIDGRGAVSYVQRLTLLK